MTVFSICNARKRHFPFYCVLKIFPMHYRNVIVCAVSSHPYYLVTAVKTELVFIEKYRR